MGKKERAGEAPVVPLPRAEHPSEAGPPEGPERGGAPAAGAKKKGKLVALQEHTQCGQGACARGDPMLPLPWPEHPSEAGPPERPQRSGTLTPGPTHNVTLVPLKEHTRCAPAACAREAPRSPLPGPEPPSASP